MQNAISFSPGTRVATGRKGFSRKLLASAARSRATRRPSWSRYNRPGAGTPVARGFSRAMENARMRMTLTCARVVSVLCVALLPFTMVAQEPQRPSSRADEILKQEGYASPPRELAEAVLAPRHLNVTLSNVSRDTKWFVDEIGDGPVLMKTFAKPFHELGGVFVDYKANRARALTIRNSVGIQILSAADGSKRQIQIPPGVRVSNATWSPDSTAIAFFAHGEDATHVWL